MHHRHDLITCFVIRPGPQSQPHEFLQLHRRPDDFMGDTWQPIAGGIEPGEAAPQAALRELREEAGLIPLEFYQVNPINTFYIAAQDTLWHAVPFCAIVDRSAIVTLNNEHDAFRWISRPDADKLFMWPGDRQSVLEISRQILDGGLAKPFMRLI